jgi:hypothetical protein
VAKFAMGLSQHLPGRTSGTPPPKKKVMKTGLLVNISTWDFPNSNEGTPLLRNSGFLKKQAMNP